MIINCSFFLTKNIIILLFNPVFVRSLDINIFNFFKILLLNE